MKPSPELLATIDTGLSSVYHTPGRLRVVVPRPALFVETAIESIGCPGCRPVRPVSMRFRERPTQYPALSRFYRPELERYLPGPTPAGFP